MGRARGGGAQENPSDRDPPPPSSPAPGEAHLGVTPRLHWVCSTGRAPRAGGPLDFGRVPPRPSGPRDSHAMQDTPAAVGVPRPQAQLAGRVLQTALHRHPCHLGGDLASGQPCHRMPNPPTALPGPGKPRWARLQGCLHRAPRQAGWLTPTSLAQSCAWSPEEPDEGSGWRGEGSQEEVAWPLQTWTPACPTLARASGHWVKRKEQNGCNWSRMQAPALTD